MRTLVALPLIAVAMLFASPVRAQEQTPTLVIGQTYPTVVAPFCTTAEDAQRLAPVFEDGGVQAGFSHLKEMTTCFYFGSEFPLKNIKIVRLVEKDISVKDKPEKLSIVEIEPAGNATHEHSLFVLTNRPVSEGQPS